MSLKPFHFPQKCQNFNQEWSVCAVQRPWQSRHIVYPPVLGCGSVCWGMAEVLPWGALWNADELRREEGGTDSLLTEELCSKSLVSESELFYPQMVSGLSGLFP